MLQYLRQIEIYPSKRPSLKESPSYPASSVVIALSVYLIVLLVNYLYEHSDLFYYFYYKLETVDLV